ncbi:MAG TPA: hypothetical protein VI423_00960, partial [Paenisporosarcina sp.]|nr:hypothetical protein [Paenisporosarcina sp.]
MQLENINQAMFLKQNDTATQIKLRVLDYASIPVLLTGKTVEVIIGNTIGRLLIKTPTLLTGVGELSFGLDVGDVLPSGDQRLEVHIVETNGERVVAPSKGFYKLKVQQSIDEIQAVVTTFTLQYYLDQVTEKTASADLLLAGAQVATTNANIATTDTLAVKTATETVKNATVVVKEATEAV